MKRIRTDSIFNTHCHLRGMNEMHRPLMKDLVRWAHRGGVYQCIAMPNTDPFLTSAELVIEYNNLLAEYAGDSMKFIPIGMLTEETTTEDLHAMYMAGIRDVKVYPRFRTTKSEKGVRDYSKIHFLVGVCGDIGIRVHVHPEHPFLDLHGRDAEYLFIPVVDDMIRTTKATIIWEHGTDARCIALWEEWAKTKRFFVTLTAHHLALNEDRVLGDPRCACKPPIKTERDRTDLVRLVERDYDWVMAGADDAPHPQEKKFAPAPDCACGDYTAPFLASLYAHALDDLLTVRTGERVFRRFTNRNACSLYGLKRSGRSITLERRGMTIPFSYKAGDWEILPCMAGQTILWSHSRV